jgi:hypothetical protein
MIGNTFRGLLMVALAAVLILTGLAAVVAAKE